MTTSNLSWLAGRIVSTLRELKADEAVIGEIAIELDSKDKLETLLWCNTLNYDVKKALANTLGIDAGNFITTLKTLQRL